MENDRREDPQPEAVSSQPEAPAYREAEERREDYRREEQPREDYREAEPEGGQGGEAPTFDAEGRQTEEGAPSSEQQTPSGPPGQGHQDRDRGGRGRGGRRGGRRMSQRERRQDRGRRRDHRPGFSGSHHGGGGGGYQQHGGPTSHREQGSEPLRGDQPQPRPEGSGSVLNDIRAEVERLREVLEGVLRDLEDVAEQLIKAEHEKDLSEAEIEQLREQLRRLHR